MSEPTKHPLVEEAIRIIGSQGRLAQAIGSSQSAVSRMLLREIPVTAEVAVAIERATERKVPRWRIRPDLWDPPGHSAQAEEAA
ncbi:YdaS family helix-turn-helix protein [uncultured Methylobacterium sp.]|jgi:DNA-binding transcriptional regulator YdaS (Cro superfamily)|uniref:transcriptional regulator n=1 Tax=uncultured Methylobacterium sp. TaxID=157278 RepID=UPI002610647E|nr:YdaS family helix-turn-helix protein [uncultured Methylobacterium sp.]